MTKKELVIAIAGPTASGKSALAVEFAKKYGGEIISADSRQIYKEFDIATAKPSEREKEGIPHHLIDVVEPTVSYTAADYADSADKCIKDILNKGKLPIAAGGTGLYFRTLLGDFDIPRVKPNESLRQELEEIVQREGVEKLYKILEQIDPDFAKTLHPNNTVKIIRAIEVCKGLGIPMSKAQKKKEPPYDVLWIGLDSNDRQFLYERINKRVDVMIEKGLIEEAKRLFEKYGRLEIMMNTIGYQEFYDCFYGEKSIQEAVEQVKQNSRRYAKRQMTWFRANKEMQIIYIDTDEDIFKSVEKIYCKKSFC